MSAFSLWGRLKQRLSGNIHVGRDHLGNNYYSIKGTSRRFVDYGGGEVNHGALPPLWRAWVTNRRQDPPTDREYLEEELKRQNYLKKVEEFEKQDNLLRIEEMIEKEREFAKALKQKPKEPEAPSFEEWKPK